MNEHDRTKNRKTYYLKKSEQLLEKVETSLAEVAEGAVDISSCTTAEEFFSKEEQEGEEEFIDEKVVESVLHDILNQALERDEIEIDDIFLEEKNEEIIDQILMEEETKQTLEIIPATPEPKSIAFSEHETEATPSEFEATPSIIESDTEKPPIVKRRHKRAQKIINEQQLQQGKLNLEILRKNISKDNDLMDEFTQGKNKDKLHSFHSHVLLYYGCYDTKQVRIHKII